MTSAVNDQDVNEVTPAGVTPGESVAQDTPAEASSFDAEGAIAQIGTRNPAAAALMSVIVLHTKNMQDAQKELAEANKAGDKFGEVFKASSDPDIVKLREYAEELTKKLAAVHDAARNKLAANGMTQTLVTDEEKAAIKTTVSNSRRAAREAYSALMNYLNATDKDHTDADLFAVAAQFEPKTATSTESTNAAPKGKVAEMRAWLKENGYSVADKGRLAPELVAAYNNAHQDSAPVSDADVNVADDVDEDNEIDPEDETDSQ